MCIIGSISVWKTNQKSTKWKSSGFFHSAMLASCVHDLWRKPSSQMEEFGISFWVTEGWSLLSLLLKLPALFQLLKTPFVFPLTLTRFSVDLTLLDAIFRKAVYWGIGNGVFLHCSRTQCECNPKLISAKTSCSMWGIPVLSGLTLQHSLVMNSLHTKLAHIINAFCWKAIVDCIPTPDLQGAARPRDGSQDRRHDHGACKIALLQSSLTYKEDSGCFYF